MVTQICFFNFITIIFIAITFFTNTFLQLFISLECKYNWLQFGISISSIEVSKQKLHISKLCMSTAKRTEGNPFRSNFFPKNEGIYSVFRKELASVQPSSAEELTELEVKGLEETLLDVLRTNQPLLIFSLFAHVTVLLEVIFLILFYKARAIYRVCASKKNTWHLAHMVHQKHIFCLTDVCVYVKLHLWRLIGNQLPRELATIFFSGT